MFLNLMIIMKSLLESKTNPSPDGLIQDTNQGLKKVYEFY